MAVRRDPLPTADRSVATAARVALEAGIEIRGARRRRSWTLRELGSRAGLTGAAIHRIESGHPGSIGSYAKVGIALGLRPELHLVDERRHASPPSSDTVHAWMGDVEAARFQAMGFQVAIDEPYQHYQFAGRGDVVAWSVDRRALLHIENRTQVPNLQEAAGSYNAKRAYLAIAICDRIHLRGGWASASHVMVGLWSAEVQHVLRLRTPTFRAICPDGPAAFEAWWRGEPPTRGSTSTFVLLDPTDRPRSRRWVGLDAALKADPRYSDYADAASAIAVVR